MCSGKWLVNREVIESNLNVTLSEETWNNICEEIAGRVDNFIDEILDGVVEQELTREREQANA